MHVSLGELWEFIMDREAWCAPIHVVTKSWTQLSDWTKLRISFSSVQSLQLFASPTLSDPMDCNMPGLPVHHHLPEFTQTHVHWVTDAIFCHLLLPSIFPKIRVFFNESVLRIRWSEYWSFSFSISPSMNIQDWFLLGWTGWISLQSKGLPRVFSNTTVQKHQFFGAQLSL